MRKGQAMKGNLVSNSNSKVALARGLQAVEQGKRHIDSPIAALCFATNFCRTGLFRLVASGENTERANESQGRMDAQHR